MMKLNYEFSDNARQRGEAHDVRSMRLVFNLNLSWNDNREVFRGFSRFLPVPLTPDNTRWFKYDRD